MLEAPAPESAQQPLPPKKLDRTWWKWKHFWHVLRMVERPGGPMGIAHEVKSYLFKAKIIWTTSPSKDFYLRVLMQQCNNATHARCDPEPLHQRHTPRRPPWWDDKSQLFEAKPCSQKHGKITRIQRKGDPRKEGGAQGV